MTGSPPWVNIGKCSIDGCERKSEKRGWCGTHYARWRAHGDPSITKKAPNGAGYVHFGYSGHQINGVRKFDHVRIAELALGRQLPTGAVVHHVNQNRLDNSNSNLVICPDRAYHNLIHARMAAIDTCGNPDCRPCGQCKKHYPVDNFITYTYGTSVVYRHISCPSRRITSTL